MSHELQTFMTECLSSTHGLRLTEVTVEQVSVRRQLTATAATACCPCCTVPSSAVHSRYQRHLTDLPWGTRLVRIQLMVRTFVCRHLSCARRIVTEHLPELVAVYARKTNRSHQCVATGLRLIADVLGEGLRQRVRQVVALI
jgi:transposase